MNVPMGAPSAVAAASPAVTVASARPRLDGSPSTAATPTAVGANIAAPSPAMARLAKTVGRSVASAVTTLPAMKTPSAPIKSVLRDQLFAAAAMTGAIRAYDSA
jgi:hypothetical protein